MTPKVVGNQDDGRAQLVSQLAHQVENLRLNRHVQRGRRLIGDEQLRIARQRHRNHDPLPHTAAKLVRILVDAAVRFGDADQAQHIDGFFPGRLLVELLVQNDGFHDLVADGEHRIQRSHRLLENHGNIIAANFAHFRR